MSNIIGCQKCGSGSFCTLNVNDHDRNIKNNAVPKWESEKNVFWELIKCDSCSSYHWRYIKYDIESETFDQGIIRIDSDELSGITG